MAQHAEVCVELKLSNQREDLIGSGADIAIRVGPLGIGKTHLAIALGFRAVQASVHDRIQRIEGQADQGRAEYQHGLQGIRAARADGAFASMDQSFAAVAILWTPTLIRLVSLGSHDLNCANCPERSCM